MSTKADVVMVSPTRGRISLLQKYNGKPCPYCGEPMNAQNPPSREHVVPRSHGGKLTADNTLVVCRPCNGDKSDSRLEDFAEALRRQNDPRLPRIEAIIATLVDGKLPLPMQPVPPKEGGPARKAPKVPYHESMMAMRHGSKFLKAFKAGLQPPCQCCPPLQYAPEKIAGAPSGSMASALNSGMLSLPRGATLPKDDGPTPVYIHSACQPPRKLTGLEAARYLREEAEKRGRKWPLA